MLSRIKQLEAWLHPHCGLLLLLCGLIILRLPNLTEPYWYGDEGIYLTLGNALRAGERLYAEIIDHKTPLIYYLAMTPSQAAFRVLLLGWMLVTTTAFYGIAKKLLSDRWTLVSTAVFILFTTLPWLEGNIPNGELFVMGFVLVGMSIASRTSFVTSFLHDKSLTTFPKKDQQRLLMVGGLLGLGILTKVPALFDALAVLVLAWHFVTRRLRLQQLAKPATWRPALIFSLLIGFGIVVPLFLSVVYFVARGSGQAYLDFGLLYNFRYAGSWGLPFNHPLLIWAFSLLGKTAIMTGLLLLLTLGRRQLTPAFQWVASWSVLAIFASLLSNRPYPHYFIQLIPPLVLTGAVAWENLIQRQKSTPHHSASLQMVTAGTLIVLSYGIMKLLQVGFYPTVSYYQTWWRLVSGQISYTQYQESFNWIIRDNNRVSEILGRSPDPYLFIWGTNPMLYAQSGKVPTGRFTVAFHIKDFKAYQETLDSIKLRQPTFIVVMNEDAATFPEFTQYLLSHYYMPNESFDHFTLWKRQ